MKNKARQLLNDKDPNEIYQSDEEVLPEVDNSNMQPRKTRKQPIPQSWLTNCPLEKVRHNIAEIQKFQAKQIYPQLDTLDFRSDIDPFLYNEQEHLNYFSRVQHAKAIIAQYQKKLAIKQVIDQGASIKKEEAQQHPQQPQHPQHTNRSTVQTVMHHALMRLEQFLVRNFKLKIKMLSRKEFRQISSFMIRCTIQFSPEVCQTLFYFINLAYNIPQERKVKVSQIVKFYKTYQLLAKFKLERKLEDVNVNKPKQFELKSFKQLAQKTRLKTIWNAQYDKFLLAKYRQQPKFGYVRCAFQDKYKPIAHLFTTIQIKDVFDSIIRKAMKIMRDHIASFNNPQIPQLFGLNQKNFKKISKGGDSLHIRLWLLDIYERGDISVSELKDIVTVMNEHISNRQSKGQYLSSLSSSLASLSSVTEQTSEMPSETAKSIYVDSTIQTVLTSETKNKFCESTKNTLFRREESIVK